MKFRDLIEAKEYYVVATNNTDGMYDKGEWFYSKPFRIHSDAEKLYSELKKKYKSVSIKSDISNLTSKKSFSPLAEAEINENEVKFQALAKMKEIQSALADLTFLDVIAVMNPENPLKKEVQKMETQINELTKVVGDFVEANMADATEVGDEPEEEETEEPEEGEEEENAEEDEEEIGSKKGKEAPEPKEDKAKEEK